MVKIAQIAQIKENDNKMQYLIKITNPWGTVGFLKNIVFFSLELVRKY